MPKRIFLLLCMLSAAFSSIDGMVISSSIDPSGSATGIAESEFSDSAGSTVTFNFSGRLDDIEVRDRSGLVLDPVISYPDGSTLIEVGIPYDYIKISFTSHSFTSKDAGLWDFRMLLSASEDIQSFKAELSLPKNAVLKSTNGRVQAEDTLLIGWEATDIDTSHRANLRAGYELANTEEDPDPLPYAAIGVLLVAAAVIFLFRKKQSDIRQQGDKKENPQESSRLPVAQADSNTLQSNPVFKTLDETDKSIILEISAQGGTTTQAHIHLQMHIPKVTLSRRLDSLENRGIIKKTRKGIRNLVSISDLLK